MAYQDFVQRFTGWRAANVAVDAVRARARIRIFERVPLLIAKKMIRTIGSIFGHTNVRKRWPTE